MNSANDTNNNELEQTVTIQTKKISEMEKKIGDLYNNQNNFMEMMEKMNNLSFQILDEIRELKEKNYDNQANKYKTSNYNSSNVNYIDSNKHQTRKVTYSSGLNFYNPERHLNVIDETKADLLYSSEKNRNSIINNLQEPEKDKEFARDKSPLNHNILIENNYENKFNRISSKEKYLTNNYFLGQNNNNYYNNSNINQNNKYTIEQENSRYNIRKHSNSRTNTQNNFNSQNNNNNINNNNSKNNSFYTNKFSNINNNFLNDIGDDETIFSISNDINILRNNLNERNNDFNDAAAFGKIMEILPSFFKNEKLFSNFEIKDKTIKRIKSSYDFGYFGIRCRDPLDSSGGKYYFSLYLQNTLKSNIFLGMTSDARMGVPNGYHKSHNTFMYNLSNCDAFLRTNSQMGNFVRKGKTGDIYTFYVDFEFKFIKLFLNGNELSHNNITIYSNENSFYPCIDIKDADDSVSFVDRIILNFSN